MRYGADKARDGPCRQEARIYEASRRIDLGFEIFLSDSQRKSFLNERCSSAASPQLPGKHLPHVHEELNQYGTGDTDSHDDRNRTRLVSSMRRLLRQVLPPRREKTS